MVRTRKRWAYVVESRLYGDGNIHGGLLGVFSSLAAAMKHYQSIRLDRTGRGEKLFWEFVEPRAATREERAAFMVSRNSSDVRSERVTVCRYQLI